MHRLIMTPALVTVVFSPSNSRHEDKAAQKEIVDGLIAIDFSQYCAFVAEKVAQEPTAILVPIGEDIVRVDFRASSISGKPP